MVRKADIYDRPEFLRLWQDYLTEQRDQGSHLLDSRVNLHLFLGFFEAYVFGSLRGVAVMWQPLDLTHPVGTLLAGQTARPDDWETDLGETATFWGVYIEPEYRGRGAHIRLFKRAQELGLELGLDTIETGFRTGNHQGRNAAKAAGTQPFAETHFISLHDPQMLKNRVAERSLARGESHGN